VKPPKTTIKAGRHDAAALRHSKRAGRERGCWVYVPAEQLVEAGLNPYDPAPDYRVWSGKKRTLLVQLYEATG
jgi:hypothetical protein